MEELLLSAIECTRH